MSREKFDADTWGRQLDAAGNGAAGADPEQRLARRLRRHRPETPAMPDQARLALRRELLDSYEQPRGWRRLQSWAANAAALALLLVVVVLAWGWLGGTDGGAGLTAPTTVTPAATATAGAEAVEPAFLTATPVLEPGPNPDFPGPTPTPVPMVPALPATVAGVNYLFFDDGRPVLELIGYEWVDAAETVTITLYWLPRVPEVAPETYQFFLHLEDSTNGARPFTYDAPLGAEQLDQEWAAGALLVDSTTIEKDQIPDGLYVVHVGLYDAGTGQRLTADPAGTESGAVTLPEQLPLVRLPVVVDGEAAAGRAWIVESEPAGGQPMSPGVPITVVIAYELTGVDTAELSARLRWTDQETGFAPGEPFITTVTGPSGTVTANLMVPSGEARVAVDLTVALFLATYDAAGRPISPLLFNELDALSPPWQFMYHFGPAEE